MEVKSRSFEKFKVQIAEKLERKAQGQAHRMRLGPRSQNRSGWSLGKGWRPPGRSRVQNGSWSWSKDEAC